MGIRMVYGNVKIISLYDIFTLWISGKPKEMDISVQARMQPFSTAASKNKHEKHFLGLANVIQISIHCH